LRIDAAKAMPLERHLTTLMISILYPLKKMDIRVVRKVSLFILWREIHGEP
jgi:hypothetical protein